jgi:hypothetical protein
MLVVQAASQVSGARRGAPALWCLAHSPAHQLTSSPTTFWATAPHPRTSEDRTGPCPLCYRISGVWWSIRSGLVVASSSRAR